jgi:outer membrane immunogenic protein
MKKILSGCAAVVFSAGFANATDLPVRAPNVYKATSAYSWSGLYGGISGGYAWGENKIVEPNLAGLPPTIKTKPNGGFGGLQLGYNNHFAPHWLIGGEIDISAGDIQGDAAFNAPPVLTMQDKFNFFGTARTRFGYVQDRWLVYGTAGAIWLQDKYKLLAPGSVLQVDAQQYHVGWVFGGGVEYAVDNRWSWKLEYLYAPFSRSHDTGQGITRSWDPSFSFVRAGLNYRFADGGAPASYMPAKAAAPRSNWSGSYIGLHGGYGWARLEENQTQLNGVALLKPDGWYGGFQGGYNWLFAPQYLLGFEIDTSFGSLKGDQPFASAPGVPTSGKIDNLGTARLRLGYLVTPDTLLYATGGAAYAREKLSVASAVAFETMNTKVDHLGWTIGGGVEYKFAPEWSLKAEYLYADLGTFKDNTPSLALTRTGDLTLNTVRVGINYSGPVIERLFGGR